MENKTHLISPKLDELADSLIDAIKNKKNFFSTTYIAFPNKYLESWFKTYWLKTQDDVLANVKYLSLTDALLSMLDLPKSYSIVQHSTLRSLTIKHIVSDFDSIPNNIQSYLKEKDCFNPAKLYDLANELSNIFLKYDDDSYEISSESWEKKIYDDVISECLELKQGTLYSIYKKAFCKFKKISHPIYFFGLSSLSKCEETLLEECLKVNEIYTYEIGDIDSKDGNELSVFAAPSKLREVEILHSKICKLLNDETINYSDILVLAPDMSEYEIEINRVFKQDGKEFPSIPYSIIDSTREKSDVTAGLNVLFDIANKGFTTRKDFISLISNKSIMQARNITDDDIENYTQSIINMNVFRDSETHDDWQYAKKRVLISKLAPLTAKKEVNVIKLKDERIIPFSNLSFDNESISKFTDFINAIQAWESFVKVNKFVSKKTLEDISAVLSYFFSYSSDGEAETNLCFSKVLKVISLWKDNKLNEFNIPFNTFMYSLIDASLVNEINNGALFTRGISFMSFSIGNVLSAKYIYFLGCSSSFPKQYIKSELDERTDSSFDKSKDEAKTFFKLYNNATKNFVASFVNKDLKNDEEFYPSSLILKYKVDPKKDIKIYSIDETRPYSDLYTRKEYKDKNYYNGLLNETEETNVVIESSSNVNIQERVKLSKMANFLEEPLKYKMEQILGKKFNNDEEINNEFEPFTINNIDRSVLVSELIQSLIDRKVNKFDDEEISKLVDDMELTRAVPMMTKKIENIAVDKLIAACQKYKEYLDANLKSYSASILEDLIFQGDDSFILVCDKACCKGKVIKDDIEYNAYLPLKEFKEENIEESDFAYIYIYSLMDIAKQNSNEEVNVMLIVGKTEEKAERTYSITSEEARNLLLMIHAEMIDTKDFIAKPLGNTKDFDSKTDLIENLFGEHGPWGYFSYRRLLDTNRDICPDFDNFHDEYKEIITKHKALAKYVKPAEKKEKKK